MAKSTLAFDQILLQAAAVIVETTYWDGNHLMIVKPKKFNKAKRELEILFKNM